MLTKKLIACGAALLCWSSSALSASPLSTGPVKLVVSTPAGGTSDTIARVLADKLREKIDLPVIVENRVGASGSIGASYVSRAAPDGHTLFLATGSTQVVAPLLMENISYDPVKDFTPIVLIGKAPFVLYANSQLPVTSLKGLIEHAKKSAAPLNFGTTGPAAIYEVAALVLENQAGLTFNHIPYKGLAPMVLDISAGRLDLSVGPIGGYLNTDKIKVLSALGKERASRLPNVPSAAEDGYAEFNVPVWAAIFGPRDMPKETANYLSDALQAILKEPDVAKAIEETGVEVVTGDAAKLAQTVQADLKLVGDTIKQSRAK